MVTGVWRAAGQGRGHAARLDLDGEDVTVRVGDDVLAAAPFSMLDISPRVGSIARHIRFPDGSDFETADNDAVDALSSGDRGGSLVHQMEQFRPRLAIFVVLAVALAFATYRYAVPLLVEAAIYVTPPAVTRLMSRSVMISLDAALFEPSTLPADRQKKLASDFAALAALSPGVADDAQPETRYSLNFRAGGTIGPNAFALPDGTIVLTDELVELAGNDDEMIMGVLAHEIGHVVHEHSLRQLYRAAGVATLIMLIGGDIGSGAEDVLVQGSALIALSYSRDAEREADHHSVELMHAAGRDPAAITRFFELMRDRFGDRGDADFFSTHPATPERIEETRRYAEEIGGKP